MEVLYTVFGFVMILVAALRRTRSNEEFFVDGHGRYFRTSGRVVLVTSLLALSLYINLIALLLSQWHPSAIKSGKILNTRLFEYRQVDLVVRQTSAVRIPYRTPNNRNSSQSNPVTKRRCETITTVPISCERMIVHNHLFGSYCGRSFPGYEDIASASSLA